ncbi:MAG: Gfo/Idh/MocA family oxidoreductase, partial [Candidatus Altiarchaeota archaeon]
MAKIRFAVIGCGAIGARHAERISGNPHAELAYVCDIKPDRAKMLAEKYASQPVTDYHELLKGDFEVANVCTPNSTHSGITVDFLKAGK